MGRLIYQRTQEGMMFDTQHEYMDEYIYTYVNKDLSHVDFKKPGNNLSKFDYSVYASQSNTKNHGS